MSMLDRVKYAYCASVLLDKCSCTVCYRLFDIKNKLHSNVRRQSVLQHSMHAVTAGQVQLYSALHIF